MNSISLFLDSGAYSAFSKGVEIDIQDYIAFIKENVSIIDVYANLDVIGDPEATWRNQQEMEKAGLSPLPCFHYGEDFRYLQVYLERYDYIALGGMVPITTEALIRWLDIIFSSYICSDNLPKIRVHGFGLTSLKLMLRYPWYSVDSTSWAMTSRMGSVYVPRFKKGKWIYDEDSWKIVISSRSPVINQEAGKHFSSLSPMVQQILLDYFHQKGYQVGKSEFHIESVKYKLKSNERWGVEKGKNNRREVETILEEGLSNSYKQRDELNIIYFLDLEKSFPEWPWPFQKKRTGFDL